MANATSHNEQDLLASLPKQIWYKGDHLYQLKGFWFRTQYLLGTQRVLHHFKPLPTDVILASFPKTGTTWMKSLLHSVVNRNSGDSLYDNHPHELVPSLEIQLYKENDTIPPRPTNTGSSTSTRILSTHIPYQLFAEKLNASDCRVVYVTRNPKDTLVSLMHFVMNAREATENFSSEKAVDLFCRGVLPFGPYYDHVLGYWKESLRRSDKVFFVTYEELKEDPKTHLRRLAEFLKCPFNGKDGEDQQVDDIVKKCSFENLSNYDANKSSHVPDWIEVPYSSFFRLGKVGDHKNYLEDKDVARIDEMTRERFHKSGFMYVI
ncbi:hypothetical protein QQ045_024495 [Rhodiola kirilowii]